MINDISPAELFGGTWELFGTGKVTVGYDANDSDFNQLLRCNLADEVDDESDKFYTGGYKEWELTKEQMPSHSHSLYMRWQGVSTGSYWAQPPLTANNGEYYCAVEGRTIGYTGGSQPHPNMQPYIVVKRWIRVE